LAWSFFGRRCGGKIRHEGTFQKGANAVKHLITAGDMFSTNQIFQAIRAYVAANVPSIFRHRRPSERELWQNFLPIADFCQQCIETAGAWPPQPNMVMAVTVLMRVAVVVVCSTVCIVQLMTG